RGWTGGWEGGPSGPRGGEAGGMGGRREGGSEDRGDGGGGGGPEAETRTTGWPREDRNPSLRPPPHDHLGEASLACGSAPCTKMSARARVALIDADATFF